MLVNWQGNQVEACLSPVLLTSLTANSTHCGPDQVSLVDKGLRDLPRLPRR